ncbi:MAG: hypothetical protein WCI78_10250 [Mycobacterium sp.]
MDASDVGITDDMSESELVVCEGEILSRAEQFATSQGWIPQVTLMSPVGDANLKDVLDSCTVSFDKVHDAIKSLNTQATALYQPLYDWLYHTFPEIQENLTNAASWYDQADQEAASAMNGVT